MSSLRVDRLAALYTMDPAREGLGALFGVSLVFDQGRLVYLGDPDGGPAAVETLDGRGLIGMPGLVDPHTHTIFAGSRAEEFRQRLAGVPYTAILEAGGGILSTVRATRAASVDELLALAQARLARLAEAGVSTVEVKSGYGLDVQAEVRILEVAGRLGGGMRVIPTFLGAHAIPAEHRGDRRAYVRQVIDEQLPRCAPLAEAIDVYCDRRGDGDPDGGPGGGPAGEGPRRAGGLHGHRGGGGGLGGDQRRSPGAHRRGRGGGGGGGGHGGGVAADGAALPARQRAAGVPLARGGGADGLGHRLEPGQLAGL
jgi:hypothetical protein